MDKSIERNAPNGPTKPTGQPQKQGPNDSGRPTFSKSEPVQAPTLAPGQSVLHATPKDAIKAPHPNDVVNTPLRAAKGDDDLMSQESKKS